MILRDIIPKEQGHYIHRYDLAYTLEDGSDKVYEIISRKKDLHVTGELRRSEPDAVVIIATDDSGERILLNKEFRMAVGEWVYSFPAGLIEPGESYLECARRELKEETGVNFVECIAVLPPSYASQGTSDELMQIVICICEGEIKDSTFEEEEIHANWYTKGQVKKLLDDGAFMSVRTQMFLWQWVHEKE